MTPTYPAPTSTPILQGWYVVDRCGRDPIEAFDRQDAEVHAALCNQRYPSLAPHRAVYLLEIR